MQSMNRTIGKVFKCHFYYEVDLILKEQNM